MFDGDFDKPKYFTLGEFRFTKGEVLEDVKVEYTCVGTPIVDDDGNITNAVVYCHGSSGDYGSIRRIEEISGKNEAFDTDKFFFISRNIFFINILPNNLIYIFWMFVKFI